MSKSLHCSYLSTLKSGANIHNIPDTTKFWENTFRKWLLLFSLPLAQTRSHLSFMLYKDYFINHSNTPPNFGKTLARNGVNLRILDFSLDGSPTMFAPIMIATLSTCAQLERENIRFRLNSGRKLAIERGVKLGRKVGSIKTTEQKREEHRDSLHVRQPLCLFRCQAGYTNRAG